MNMKKKWIRLFQLSERSWLEENLNKFINEYDDCEIIVWNHEYLWCAQVRYSYPENTQNMQRKIIVKLSHEELLKKFPNLKKFENQKWLSEESIKSDCNYKKLPLIARTRND